MRRAPRKAFLDAESDLEFEFYLADRLGMTVARLRDELGAGEFLYWSRFHMVRQQREELAAAKGA